VSSTGRSAIVIIVIVLIGVGVGAGAYFFVYYFIPTSPTTTASPTTTTTVPTTSTITYYSYTDYWSTSTSYLSYTDYWYSTTSYWYTDYWSTSTYWTENPYDIAIVLTTDGAGDEGFNDGVLNGALSAWQDFRLEIDVVQPTHIMEYEVCHRIFAEHTSYTTPYKLIIGVGFDQADAIMSVAEDYPNQNFAIVDMFIDPAEYPNVASLLFSEHEGFALVGAIAGLITQTDSIGFVGGMDIPLINKYLAGYAFGANYTNPGVNVTYAYTNDWVDIAAGQTLADGMYTQGIDIIFATALYSGLGVFDSCRTIIEDETNTTPIWTIGYDTPQMYLGTSDSENPSAPTFCLTSMIKRVDVSVYNIIRDVFLGNFTGGLKFFNLSNNGVDYEVNSNLLKLPGSVISAVESFKADIKSGSISVPDSIY